MPKFSQNIYKVGLDPCVEVPRRVSDDLCKTGYIPVSGTINDHPFRSTLVPVGSWRHRLYISAQLQKEARVGLGDLITVVLDHDDKTEALPTPTALVEALAKHPQAKTKYDAYPPSRRGEILTYFSSLKQPETLNRHIDQLITLLETDDA